MLAGLGAGAQAPCRRQNPSHMLCPRCFPCSSRWRTGSCATCPSSPTGLATSSLQTSPIPASPGTSLVSHLPVLLLRLLLLGGLQSARRWKMQEALLQTASVAVASDSICMQSHRARLPRLQATPSTPTTAGTCLSPHPFTPWMAWATCPPSPAGTTTARCGPTGAGPPHQVSGAEHARGRRRLACWACCTSTAQLLPQRIAESATYPHTGLA
jgi:hypothetical protein